jgi:hypothetical protein
LRNRRIIGFGGGRKNRERLIAIQEPAIYDSEKNCDPNAQGKGEGYEIPQSGKAENEDEGAPGGEEQTNKSSAEGDLVHGDAGMAFVGHGAPLRSSFH